MGAYGRIGSHSERCGLLGLFGCGCDVTAPGLGGWGNRRVQRLPSELSREPPTSLPDTFQLFASVTCRTIVPFTIHSPRALFDLKHPQRMR